MERGFQIAMKRAYELTVVFRIDPNNQVMKDSIAQVKDWVEADDLGSVSKIDETHWGRRRLAYEIDGQREGYYTLFYCDIDTSGLPELERNLSLSPTVLRFLLVRPD